MRFRSADIQGQAPHVVAGEIAHAEGATREMLGARSLGTIGRVVQVLRVIAESRDDLSVSTLAAELDLPRATTHRLLTVLREHGMVDHDADTRRYRPGWEFFRIAALLSGRQSIELLARPIMKRVVAETAETCLLSIYRPHDHRLMFVAQERATHALGYTVEMHRPLTPTWGASGRAILAFLRQEDVDVVLKAASGERSPTTNKGLPRRSEFKTELAKIRKQRYAVSLSERIPHAYSVAAPVLARGAEVVGCLTVTVPEMRVQPSSEGRFAPVVVRAARELSDLLGYREDASL